MNTNTMDEAEAVKENVWQAGYVKIRWVVLGVLCSCGAVLVAAACDQALPVPLNRSAPQERFIADIAYEHLINLTSIGPRVAGSYENEVAAIKVLVSAARGIEAAASPHNRVEFDVFRASGAFSLTFIDGMSNIYRDVQSVVIRVRGAGSDSRATLRSALLLNCHYDTVPDSPGASDDAAGCAVVLETLRALAASPHPLRHDVVALLNGAEENIMQASHAFVTTHRWARSLRAFINIEACGAGGREVLFQAGPNDPWMLEVYAGAVPHPFASSLAQELFDSGLIPADTDFRIFRDFANISGVDLAWNSNGYVYHTRLDTAERMPRSVLQRTGDNVLALAHGLLSNERLETGAERTRAPVYFDVMGRVVVLARAPAAALATCLALSTVALKLYLSATQAAKELYITRMRWMRVVGRALLSVTLAQCCGLAASIAVALFLHFNGARLTFYSRPWILIPLYSVPAVVASWWDARLTWGKAQRGGGAATLARGDWTLRAWHDALCLAAAILLAAGAACGLRSSFVVFLWTLPAGADVLCVLAGIRGAPRIVSGAAAAVLPALQTAYLALAALNMFVPVMGRAGTAPLPPDVIMAVLVGALTLTLFSWMLPLVVAAKNPKSLIRLGWAVTLCTVVLVLCSSLGFPYSEERPQRFMVFHTRRTEHVPATLPKDALFYWLPALDANTPQSMHAHIPEVAFAPAACSDRLYCGAPYYLPVLSLVAHGHEFPSREQPRVTLNASAELLGEGSRSCELRLRLHGPNHIVVILSPVIGATIPWCNASRGLRVQPQPGPKWKGRHTYFISLHDALSPAPWDLACGIERSGDVKKGSKWVEISAAGHNMAGAARHTEAHAQLLARFPTWTAVTGWGVHLHLFSL